jgi:predicted nucleotidyltransferase
VILKARKNPLLEVNPMRDDFDERIRLAAMEIRSVGATEVYLIGSSATGERRVDSDVDFAVSGLPPERYIDALGLARRILHLPVDLIDLDESNPITRYLKTQGEMRLV